MPSFRVMSAIAVIIAATLACTTSVFSNLAATSATGPACTGRDLIEGYRSGSLDWWALPLFSVFGVDVVEKSRRNPKTAELLNSLDAVVFELASFRVTYGMFLVYSVFFGFVAVNASMTGFSVQRYVAISAHCQPNG